MTDVNKMIKSKRDCSIDECIIRENVRIFRPYLEKTVMVKDLIGHFELFTREQRNELLQISKTSQADATRRALDIIDQLTHPDKYTNLLDVLKAADYPKLVGLLQGKLIRVNDNHRMRLNEVTSLLYKHLNPTDVLPFLQQTGVISLEDADAIRKVETHQSRCNAALELQYILPNRHRDWYELLIWSLVKSRQSEIAETIDDALTKAIQDGGDKTFPKCRQAISLQSLFSVGSHERLTDTPVNRGASGNILNGFRHLNDINYQKVHSNSTVLDAIYKLTVQLHETIRHFAQNNRNGSSNNTAEFRSRAMIEKTRQELSRLLDKLDEYMNNQKTSGDQILPKSVEVSKPIDKTVVKNAKSEGIVFQRECDASEKLVITNMGFPYKISPVRKISLDDRKTSSKKSASKSPDMKIASSENRTLVPEDKVASLILNNPNLRSNWRIDAKDLKWIQADMKNGSRDGIIELPEETHSGPTCTTEDACNKILPSDKNIDHLTSSYGYLPPRKAKMQSTDMNDLSQDKFLILISQDKKTTSQDDRPNIQTANNYDLLSDNTIMFTGSHMAKKNFEIFQRKLPDDEYTPCITGHIRMANTDIVVCDSHNKKVKRYDQSRKAADHIRLHGAPRDISRVDDDTVTVTIPSVRRIQFVQVYPRLRAFCAIQLDQWQRSLIWGTGSARYKPSGSHHRNGIV